MPFIYRLTPVPIGSDTGAILWWSRSVFEVKEP